MEIKGKVHCFFEQSGVFKNEFKKLGYEAYDYDIQNNHGETDYQIDLFKEIEDAYDGKTSLFDSIRGGQDGDLIMAFFPCIYFTGFTNPRYFTLENNNYKSLTLEEKIEKILERAKSRERFYELVIKLVGVCLKRDIRIILENPYSTSHFLHDNFYKQPDIIDKNRMLRGDFFVKPTGYWFFNCEPTHGNSLQKDKEQRTILSSRSAPQAGICSEDRSMISPDYARNFINDFILGRTSEFSQLTLF